MSRRFANYIAEQIWVLGESGVIGIDESVDFSSSEMSDPNIWKMPGTNDEAMRAQTARARCAFDRKW